MKTNIILNGDALKHLKEMPDESINCVMTSPPYWALRDYGTDVETIWDDDENCQHEFKLNPEIVRFSKDKWKQGDRIIEEKDLHEYRTRGDSFCQKCRSWKGQLGLEPTFDLYIKHLYDIFDEVKRVLRKDGTCWINLGDTYAGSGNGSNDYRNKKTKNYRKGVILYKGQKSGRTSVSDKSLLMIPFRFAIEMVNRGWILRNTIIWKKPNCMPSSVKDRFTVDFEYLFFFVKNKKYWFEQQLEPTITKDNIVRDRDTSKLNNTPGRSRMGGLKVNNYDMKNKRATWSISPKPFSEAHFAVYPEELCKTPIKSGCPEGGIVLDPFFGAGTTGLVALKQNKQFIGIELNSTYIELAKKRLKPHLEQNKLNFAENDDKFIR